MKKLKVLSFVIFMLALGLTSCSESAMTDHMLNLQGAEYVEVGTLVVDEFGGKIGEVKELIDDESGKGQLITVQESYLKDPAKFVVSLDSFGETIITAYYE